MPFLALLLLKLRGWTDNRESNAPHKREKQYIDKEDIDELLELAIEEYDSVLQRERWMPRWFIREARERVWEFVEEYPDSADDWSEIGFHLD